MVPICASLLKVSREASSATSNAAFQRKYSTTTIKRVGTERVIAGDSLVAPVETPVVRDVAAEVDILRPKAERANEGYGRAGRKKNSAPSGSKAR